MVVAKDKNDALRRELRKFGISLAIGLTVIGLIWLWRGRHYYWCFLAAAGLIGASALLKPILVWPIQKLLVSVAIAFAWVISAVVLLVFYYVILTPFSIVLRLGGAKLLHIDIDPSAESYWIERESGKPGKEHYERQF